MMSRITARICAAVGRFGASDGWVTMATRSFSLTSGDWTDLGSGPAFLGAHGDELYFAIGEDPPPRDEVGHIVRFESNPVVIAAQERILGARPARWALRACRDHGT